MGLEVGVIRSEIRSNRALLLYLRPSRQQDTGTDPLVQVDLVRVVDLDIGSSKSDNLRTAVNPYVSAGPISKRRVSGPLITLNRVQRGLRALGVFSRE